ncbi:hypothetical protein FALBO_16346 [Fusarium albosuccineum]|uniref:Uncharacterized protein n=1 Tax=Fusarium albosuccineum TaxID=1237068 RepID=A0A8H4KJE9_9HYPO|nr:hypothetical protein FALBO_16346 [Fusarium albosuccineum]
MSRRDKGRVTAFEAAAAVPLPKNAKAGTFASTKKDHMPTAKSMYQDREEKVRRVEDEEFLGPPPADKNLIQVSFQPTRRTFAASADRSVKATHIIPGKHLLPSGLDEPEALDGIRRKHRVYITRLQPNVLDIRCESMLHLQQALEAINLAIRDMRLSNEHSAVRYLVQRPTNAIISDMIRAELGTRPQFISLSPRLVSNKSSMNHHLQQLAVDMMSSAESLMSLNKSVRLRVNFGHLIIGKRKKGAGGEMSYDDFVKLMGMYSVRGGATFDNKLEGEPEEKAKQLIISLLDREDNCQRSESVEQRCELTVVAQGLEIQAEVDCSHYQNMRVSMVRATKPEAWARLNWTIAAPDMLYDWNFRVDAWDDVEVPNAFKDLAQKVSLATSSNDDTFLNIPQINTTKLAALDDEISQIRLKSSAIIPIPRTLYVLEINITKTLKGPREARETDVTWGIEFYAPHWEEIANHSSGRRKDWGQELEHIWLEGGSDLKSRFGDFLQNILEVQAFLNTVHK